MSRWHVVPEDIFAALSSGAGGARGARFLAMTQRSRRLLFLRGVLEFAVGIDQPWAVEFCRAYDQLAAWQSQSPHGAQTVEGVLAHPGVSAWVIAALRALRGGEEAPLPWYPSAVVAAVAVRLNAPAKVTLPAERGRVLLPTLGAALVGPDSGQALAAVTAGPRGAFVQLGPHVVPIPTFPNQDSPGWEGLRVMTAEAAEHRFNALLDATDPACFPRRTEVRAVADQELERWRASVSTGWALLAEFEQDKASEAAGLVSVLVPLESPSGGMASATPRTAFGAIALSEPADAVGFALAVAHESQHVKLNALADLVTLVNDDGQARWYAPWRDDPRSLTSLLHGAYAHLGVASFWRGQRLRESLPDRALHAHAEYARWREATWTALRTLRGSRALTPAGERLTTGMLRTLISWHRDQVPPEAQRRARLAARRHRRAWRLRHAGIEGR